MDVQNNGVVHEKSGTSSEILMLAFPLMISFLSYSIMGVVDTFVLGKVGTSEQAGVGMGASLCWTIFSFFNGTVSVMSTFVAQSLGANKTDNIRKWMMVGYVLVVPMSFMILPVIYYLPEIIGLMGTTDSVRPLVEDYIGVLVFSLPAWLIVFNVSGFLRGLGDMKTPMVVTLIANTTNAFLDIIFVFGYGPIPAMGVKGAALASAISVLFSAIMMVRIYFSKKHDEQFNTRNIEWVTLDEVKQFLKIGLPTGASWVAEMLAWTMMTVYVGTIKPETLAATTIVWQLLHFSFMPTVALSIAASTLVGQYLGANRVDLAKKAAIRTIMLGIGFMTIIGFVFAFGRDDLIYHFNPDPQVMKIGGSLLIIAALFQIFDALGITIRGVLQGAGDTRFPLYVQLGAGWLIFIPSIFILGEHVGWGVYGAWISGLVFVILLGLLMLWRYVRGSWLKMRVV